MTFDDLPKMHVTYEGHTLCTSRDVPEGHKSLPIEEAPEAPVLGRCASCYESLKLGRFEVLQADERVCPRCGAELEDTDDRRVCINKRCSFWIPLAALL